MGVPTCLEKSTDKTLLLRDGTFLGTQKGRQGVTKDVCCFKRKKQWVWFWLLTRLKAQDSVHWLGSGCIYGTNSVPDELSHNTNSSCALLLLLWSKSFSWRKKNKDSLYKPHKVLWDQVYRITYKKENSWMDRATGRDFDFVWSRNNLFKRRTKF